jgi:hypothetical protein
VIGVLHEIGMSTIQVDSPCGTMFLMGMLQSVDRDLAITWPTRLAVRGVEALQRRLSFRPAQE